MRSGVLLQASTPHLRLVIVHAPHKGQMPVLYIWSILLVSVENLWWSQLQFDLSVLHTRYNQTTIVA